MKSLIETLKFNASEPFVSRTAGRAVVNSLDIRIINLCAAHLRNERFGQPVADPTVDTREEQVEGAAAGAEQEQQVREEQGYEVAVEPPLKVAARLKLIRDALAADLEAHAGEREVPHPKDPNKALRIKDQFHVPRPIEAMMDFLVTSSSPLVSEATIKATAKAMGISEDEAKAAAQLAPKRRSMFLHQNREDILNLVKSLIPADKDGYALSPEQAEETFESLEPLTRLQILATADRALHSAAMREVSEYMRTGLPQHTSNHGVLQGIRRHFRGELWKEWTKEADWDKRLQAALDRGARFPDFGPVPTPGAEQKAA